MAQRQRAGFMPRRSQVRILLPLFMAEDMEKVIRDNAEGPAEASTDGQSVKQHSLRDQIEADRHLASKKAARKGLGVRRTRVEPPGAA